jgi:HAE1 family hydrophobic/amphiphilic exporter-1
MKRLGLFLVLGAAAFGQQTVSVGIQIRPLTEFQLPPRIGVAGQSHLTLEDVLNRVLQNDADIRVSRISRDQAGYQVTAAQGAYDPVVGFQAYRTRAVSPVASILGGTATGKLTQTELNFTPTVSGLTEWGGSYSFKFSNSRQQSDSLFLTLNPQYPTTATLNITQPLLRGLRFDPNRYRVEVARKNTHLSTEQVRQHVIERLTVAINAYWELTFAWQALQVQTEAVRLAQEQFESNRRQAEQGVLAPVDVVAAQTQVATFEQTAIMAQQALTVAENNLKSIMLPNREDPMWNVAVVPETEVDARPTVLPLRDAINQALASRPEMAENAIALDINKLDVRLDKDQTRPQVNAFANLSATGLSGVPGASGSNSFLSQIPGLSTTLPGLFIGNYSQSITNLFGGNFPTAQVGVQVSLPLRNRTAGAQLAIAEADGRKLKVLREQIGSAIEADVRNSLQAVASAEARLSAASLARESAEEQYASEQRQFQAGTSTVFLVLQRQSDLIAARSREVRAKADLGEAKANLDRATANTIEAHGIRVAF